MINYKKYAAKVEGLRAREEATKKELERAKARKEAIERHIDIVTEANWILGEAINRVQTSFKETIEKLVTSSIKTIYKRDIEFSLEFDQKAQRLECRPVLLEDGEEFDLDGEIGGGLLDLISFTSKVVFWKIQSLSRPVFILDEPFRFLGHGSTILAVGKLLKNLSADLGIQFIIVSHEEELAEIADRSFVVNNHNGVSKVGVYDATNKV